VFQPLEGLIKMEAQVEPEKAWRWLAAIPRVIEEWAVRQDGLVEADLYRFIDENLRRLEDDPRRRALVLIEIADGLWHAGRRDVALALNAQVRHDDVAEAWIQQAWFRLADDPAAAVTAARRAHELDSTSPIASFLVRHLPHGQINGGSPGITPPSPNHR
jgi:hypothetical protein